ncbi:hypothetical protein V6N12_008679 [Hibiscus sabdariffa]|uniref:Uncharacterized protein n=1 Tax=Hibiscus sabdariffa TaxID=183260 RepID=A0ABR2ASA9_9ROSI
MESQNPLQRPFQSHNTTSFDENEDVNSPFIDSMVDEFDEEEKMRLPKKKKNEKKGSRATIDSDTTLWKRNKKSK